MSDGIYTDIKFAPGFNKNTTSFNAQGQWVDGDKVRFRDEGRPEKIGGWIREVAAQQSQPTIDTVTGCVRDMISWRALNGNNYLATGSHLKLELLFNGQYFDITPVDAEADSTGITYATTAVGSNSVNFTIMSHLRNINDYIAIDSSTITTIGGLTVDGQYVVTSVTDVNNFTATKVGPELATSVASMNPTVDYDFLLPSGECDAGNIPGGWGVGTWNTPGVSSGGWGQERISNIPGNLRSWSLDTFGEDLLSNPRGGGLYTWDASAGPSSTNRATRLTDAPNQNLFIFVSEARRNVVSLGCTDIGGTFDPLLVRWSDTENSNQWDPTATNSVAGSIRLSSGSTLVGGVRTKNENVIFTDTATYSMQFVGGSLVYSFTELGTKAGLISPHAVQEAEGVVFWMGRDSFFVYDGVIRPLQCSIQKALFNPESEISINTQQRNKIYAGFNREFFEIIWLYPSRNSIENDRYVIYNYLYNTWYDGTLNRTAWEDRGVFPYPFAAGSNGLLYQHENTKNDDGNTLNAFIESAFFDIDEGTELMFMDRYIPDFRKITNTVNFSISTKKYIRPDAEIITKGPFPIDNNTDFINFRARGRQARIRYDINTTDGDFEVGAPRLRVLPDGKR